MVYSNMQTVSHYLQFRIKRNISNTKRNINTADERKHISQMSTIDVYI